MLTLTREYIVSEKTEVSQFFTYIVDGRVFTKKT